MVKFGSVGILNTVFSYLVFCGLIYADVYYLFASAISFIAGTVLSYSINARYTFSSARTTRGFVTFFSIMLGSLLLSMFLLYLLKDWLTIHVLIAQILVVAIRFPIVYWLMKRVVFHQVSSNH